MDDHLLQLRIASLWGNCVAGLFLFLVAVLGCAPASAEALLSATVVDGVRWMEEGQVQKALMVIVDFHDIDPELPKRTCIQERAPENLQNVEDEDCLGLLIHDSDLLNGSVTRLKSRQLGVFDGRGFLLVTYALPNVPKLNLSWRIDVAIGKYIGFYSDNFEQSFNSIRFPRTLRKDRPYEFVYRYFDDQLNGAYGRLMASEAHGEAEKAVLRQAQRSWLKSLHGQCPVPSDEGAWGYYDECRAVETVNRLKKLRDVQEQWGVAAVEIGR